jgi:hypothetical protein
MRENMNSKTFKVKIDDKEKEMLVRTPSINQQREAQKIYNQAFTDAIKSKSVVRAKMDDLLAEQGLWDDEKQAKFTRLQTDLLDNERRLAKGGINLKEAKSIALEMRKQRDDIRALISVRTSLDNHSAEGQADNARFNYLVSASLVYNDTKEQYYKDLEDYLNRSNEEVSILAAQHLASMLYGLDNDYESTLPENKFLKKYKFVDDKLRLVDKQNRLVDSEGRLIDDNGRYIDENGNYVDKFGNKVDKDGDYVVDAQPFLDDDGNPIILEEEKVNDNTKTEEKTPEEPTPVVAETVVESKPVEESKE